MAGSIPKVRVGLEVLANIVPEGGFPLLGKTFNVSSSGMLVEVSTALEVGTKLRVELFVPGRATKLQVDGEIIREGEAKTEGHEYGVRFVGLSPEAEFELARFLAIRLDKIGPSR
ncbi:MAG: PilZ domain-containing protein [Thermoanaerobaculia bacterium]